MTLYLTDDTDPARHRRGRGVGRAAAVKLYPAGATTNSDSGVTDIAKVRGVLEAMQAADVPLLVHGEVTDPDIDIFDREAVFIERVLVRSRARLPGLRIVLEHATTQEAVDFVLAADANLAATITPHHLMIDRNAILRRRHPAAFLLPADRQARRAPAALAQGGDLRRPPLLPRHRFGAPSGLGQGCACGAAGIFSAPVALPAVAQVFDEEGALDRLEAFASLNGAAFYRCRRTATGSRWHGRSRPIPASSRSMQRKRRYGYSSRRRPSAGR